MKVLKTSFVFCGGGGSLTLRLKAAFVYCISSQYQLCVASIETGVSYSLTWMNNDVTPNWSIMLSLSVSLSLLKESFLVWIHNMNITVTMLWELFPNVMCIRCHSCICYLQVKILYNFQLVQLCCTSWNLYKFEACTSSLLYLNGKNIFILNFTKWLRYHRRISR